MRQHCIVAGLLLAMSTVAAAATLPADLDELHQRQFRYARAMMQLNQIEGFERGPSIDAMLQHEREAKAKRAEQGWRDSADGRTQLMDEFAKAVERVATDQRAKHAMSRQWRIDEPYPSHWSVSGNEAAAADCTRAIEHPLGQPLRIEMNRDGIAWLRVVAPGKGYWAFDTLVSEFDTKLSVYRDCRDIGSAAKQISDDTVGLGSIVGLDAKTAGQTFLIKLERKGGVGSLAIAKAVLAGSISGRVTRASDGAPVNRAKVSAISTIGIFGSSAITQTGNTGGFSIPIYSAGDYYVRATPELDDGQSLGLVPRVYPGANCASIYYDSIDFCEGQMTPIHIDADGSVLGIELQLEKGSTISGAVLDENTHEAIFGAQVYVFAEEDESQGKTRRSVGVDSLGRYRVDGLPSRSWKVEFLHHRYYSQRWNGFNCLGVDYIPCPSGSGSSIYSSAGTNSIANASMRPGKFYLNLTIQSDRPASDVFSGVQVFGENGNSIMAYSFDQDGVLEVGPLELGRYRFAVSSRGRFSKVLGGADCSTDCYSERMSGEVVEIVDRQQARSISLRSLPAMSGRVVDEQTGVGVSDVEVRYFVDGDLKDSSRTDLDGRYEFDFIPIGIGYVQFISPRYVDELHDNVICEEYNAYLCLPANQIVVDLGSVSEFVVDAALRPSGSISGTAFRQALDRGPTISQFYITRYDEYGHRQRSERFLSATQGHYLLGDIPSGNYYFAISPIFFDRPQVFDNKDCPLGDSESCILSGQIVTVSENSVREGVDFNVVPQGTRAVRLVDEVSGLPIEGVAVDRWSLEGVWLGSRTTNANGVAFVDVNLSAGPENYYAVKISTDTLGRYIEERYDNLPCPVGASAFNGGCSIDIAWAVPVSDSAGVYLPPIEIRLRSADPVFESGFE